MKKQENVIIGIYKITSPSGKIYIGQSVDILNRWKQYNLPSQTKSQYKIHRSLKTHKIENHKFEIICECEINELDQLETLYKKFYLNKLGSWSKVLFCDLHDRGGGPKSQEHKDKIGLGNKGKTITQEHKYIISRAHKGLIYSDESKLRISNAKKGKPHTKEHNLNKKGKRGPQPNMKKPKPVGFGDSVSKRLYGVKQSEETKKKRSNSMKGKSFGGRKINQFDINNNFIKGWRSISDAKKEYKGDIQACCAGKQKTSCGFIWKYK